MIQKWQFQNIVAVFGRSPMEQCYRQTTGKNLSIADVFDMTPIELEATLKVLKELKI